jgi:hypothetical protein
MTNNHPAAAYLLNGQIELYVRTQDDKIYRTISYDNAKTWNSWKDTKHMTDKSPSIAATPEGKTRFLAFEDHVDVLPNDKKHKILRTDVFGYDNGKLQYVGGEYTSGPAVVCTPNGNTVIVFGKGNDNKFWWTGSFTGGNGWKWTTFLPHGVFKSDPAAVISADGLTMLVFGIGNDDKIWYAQSLDGGNNWRVMWTNIGQMTFTSNPAACMSADGKTIIIAGRSTGEKVYFNKSTDAGNTWKSTWEPILVGTLNGGPALCCSWDAKVVHVFGEGQDSKMWRAQSNNSAAAWQGWSQISSTILF